MWWRIAGILGALGIALGAFGAHGLKARIPDPVALGWWETGARYHLYAALALLGVAAHPSQPSWAGWLFIAGTVLFSGSLYVMTLTGMRWLGAVTPLGGLCFIAAWLVLAFARTGGGS